MSLLTRKVARLSQPEILQTKIVVTDSRVVVCGHSVNKAACVAVSVAIQTFAYTVAMLDMMACPVDRDETIPFYDVQLKESTESRAAIVGLMMAFRGIAETCPGALVLADNRRIVVPAPSARAEEPGTGSYAESVSAVPAIVTPRKPLFGLVT